MIVYTVEETRESEGYWGITEVIAIYGNKEKALAKAKEKEELYKYNDYYVTAYDTETGGIIND